MQWARSESCIAATGFGCLASHTLICAKHMRWMEYMIKTSTDLSHELDTTTLCSAKNFNELKQIITRIYTVQVIYRTGWSCCPIVWGELPWVDGFHMRIVLSQPPEKTVTPSYILWNERTHECNMKIRIVSYWKLNHVQCAYFASKLIGSDGHSQSTLNDGL